MALKECLYKYGREGIRFSLDPSLVIQELTVKELPVLKDPVAATKEAIRNPIGSKSLRDIVRPGEKVAFIVNDPTRVANSHVFMPILVDELHEMGIPDEDMRIVFSLGTHRFMTEEEMAESVGPSVARRVKMYNSDAHNPDQFDYFGKTSRGTPVSFNRLVTEADHIICTGSVVHHFFSGFGGGRKAMLPGVSSYETIRQNHSLMFDPDACIGRLEGNPTHEDQIEGVEMCRPSFLLNVVLNDRREFLGAFAGDYIQAHLEACRLVQEAYGVEVEPLADLVIASCGGYPKDINVYQLQKTMDNAWAAVREGGMVIVLGECAEGTGSALYEQWMKEYRTPESIEAKLRENFQIGAHKAYTVTRLMRKCDFVLVSSLDPELARVLLFTPAKDMGEALHMTFERLGPRPSIILMPQGGLTVPIMRS
jgi:nickel-dependent lactate racemase